MASFFPVSLVIPVFNEARTIASLIEAIQSQTRLPDEVIFVDGGSADQTASLIKELTVGNQRYRLIEAGRAMPGKGRNIGTAAAKYEWIAYTDAGITLDKDWLKHLVEAAQYDHADIVYGNFSPVIHTVFDKAATIVYVPAQKYTGIRGRVLPSSLWKKTVWESLEGFPDWRATEDLIFMDKAEKAGYKIAETSKAMMYWQLRPDFSSTFQKFDLYSKYNVWAGRQAYWHYGVAKQYLFLLPFIFLSIFHHWLWLLAVPAWLIARTIKRSYAHRLEFGAKPFKNPLLFLLVMMLIVTIDAATFSGWIKAIFNKPSLASAS